MPAGRLTWPNPCWDKLKIIIRVHPINPCPNLFFGHSSESASLRLLNPLTLGYLNLVGQARSVSAKAQAMDRLHRLRLRLHFSRIPPGWTPCPHPTDLTPAWAEASLEVEGVGYSTIGWLVEGGRTSTRFWPTSPFYQACLGGYLFQGPAGYGLTEQGALDLEALLQPVVVDQQNWLKNYGCPAPRTALKPGSFHVVEETQHQDFAAWLVEGVILSNSDVGAGNRSTDHYLPYRIYELMFARFGNIHLPSLCTLPPVWPLASYHSLELDTLGLFVRVGLRDQWALLYCCGARWGGREYFPLICDDALTALRQVRIVSG
jgi:hypothetical protein